MMLVLIDGVGILAALFLVLLAVNHLRLAWLARRPSGWCLAAAVPVSPARLAEVPDILVQIPVFNEGPVAVAALETALLLDWPAQHLTIQMLDDSTGESDELAMAIAGLPQGGPRVEHRCRTVRTGYKAGALVEGLAESQAPFVAMLDADFRPPRDWLRHAVGVLIEAPNAAFVQFRFEFANQAANALTRGQQLSVDTHFMREQAGRAAGREPFQFNGTAGVWRRSAIAAAGGWSADTLAEDLDIAMRAFAGGAEARLVLEPPVLCEAPESLDVWRVQQQRWSSGFVQVASRLLPVIWRAPLTSLARLSTLLLLGMQFALPAVLVTIAAFVLDGLIRGFGAGHAMLAVAAAGFAVLTLLALTYPPFRQLRRGSFPLFCRAMVALPGLLIYMAAVNAIPVLAAWRRKDPEFIRTPKTRRN